MSDPRAVAAALAGLNGMTPPRLSSLLRRHCPEDAWAVVTGDRPDAVVDAWFRRHPALAHEFRHSARSRPPDAVWEACLATETSVMLHGTPEYPRQLADDPEAPAVLFARGRLDALAGRRVGIVGTRNCTEGGARLATRLGRTLAEAGVAVVSGLARGIDGRAHVGALDATTGTDAGSGRVPGRPVAVVASGTDVPYPSEHRDLWESVALAGLLISEHPPGSPPLGAWFPLRNRILAALSEVLVVVESRARGGSLVTARLAADRGIPVLAVPGSLLNRAAEGTNRLIVDGATAVLDPTDVLVALGLESSAAHGPRPDHRTRPRPSDRAVLAAFDGDALTLDQVLLRVDLTLTEVALAVGRLEAAGWLNGSSGWFEPVPAATEV